VATSRRRPEIPGEFLNVVLEKDGVDQFDWSREKWRRSSRKGTLSIQ